MKKIILILIVTVLNYNYLQAQCDNDDYECWLTEIVLQIENGNFTTKGKPFRRATKRKSPSEVKIAAQALEKNRIKKYYKPIAGIKISSTQKHSEKYYKESLKLLNKGRELAERNFGMTNRFTKKIDSTSISFFKAKIPLVEEERIAALEKAYESGTNFFAEDKFSGALAQLEFFYREADDGDPKRTDVLDKITESKYQLAFKVADAAHDNGKYQLAFTKIQEAIKHKSHDNALNLRTEIARKAYMATIDDGKNLESQSQYDKAIKKYEKAEAYWGHLDKAMLGDDYDNSSSVFINDANENAAGYYLSTAITSHRGGNYENALKALNKSKKYSSDKETLYKNENLLDENDLGVEYNAEGLLNEFFEEKSKKAENLYNEKKFNEAEKNFKAAGVYKDKVKMDENILFVNSVKEALRIESKYKHKSDSSSKEKIANAWNLAIQKQADAHFTGEIGLDEKFRLANSSATSTKTSEYKNSRAFSMTNLEPIVLTDKDVPIIFNLSNEDGNFGGGVRITAYVEFRIKRNNPTILQAKFTIGMKECCGGFNRGNTYRGVESKAIDIAKIPDDISQNFRFPPNYTFNYSNKEYFKYKGKELNKFHLKHNPPPEIHLELHSQRVIDAKIFATNVWNFNFNTARINLALKNKNNTSGYSNSSSAVISSSPAINNSDVYPRSNGKYFIQSAIGGRYLDVVGAKPGRWTPLQLWSYKGAKEQRFKLVDAGGGYFYIQSELGRALHIQDSNKNPKANVNLWEIVNQDNLKWKFIDAGNGYYYIQSKLGTNLDVQWAKNANGTPIWMWGANNGIAQKWKLKKVN